MSDNVFLFKPKADLTADKNLQEFIERSKELTVFGEWGNNKWDTVNGVRKIVARFSTNTKPYNSYKFEPLEAPFIDFAKAYIRYTYSMKPVTNLQRHMEAIRILEESLIEVKGNADILLVDGSVLSHLNSVFSRRITNPAGKNKSGYQLEILLDFCRENQFTPTLPEWKNPYSRVRDLTIAMDEEGKEHNSSKLPSDEEMMLVAQLFHDAPELGVETEYFTAIMALLMTAPSRGSELVTLSVDCLVWEDDKLDKKKLGIQWNPAKGGKKGVKWVPTVMEDVVVEAVDRLKRISEPARKAAKFAEENPHVFMRHDDCITAPFFPEDRKLGFEEVNSALGIRLKSDNDLHSLNTWLGKLIRKNANKATYKVLGKHQYELYTSKLKKWPFIDKAQKVKASDALLLYREYEFHTSNNPRNFSFCLPNVNQINDRFIDKDSREGMSLWYRHGIKKSDGKQIQIPSHNARHWLSTKAERGGMDELTLANWAGRARVADNRAYDHRSENEKSEQARDVLIPEDASILDKIERNLPVTYEELGKDLIGVAMVTELGVCEHDFAMMPCQRNGDCETCKELVCIKGFSGSLEQLKNREVEVNDQFEKAVKNHEMGTFGADRWVSALGWRLSHIRTKIRILEDDKTPDGTPVRIPAEFDPSPAKTVLLDKGMETEVNKPDSIELDDDIYELLGMEL